MNAFAHATSRAMCTCRPMRIHVSLHDVSSAHETALRDAISLCSSFGIRPALLVVPRFHGAHTLMGDTSFAEWLRTLQTTGHEVYTHGLEHRCMQTPRNASGWFRQKVVSAGEAEFAHLTTQECEAALDEGDGILRSAGLVIDGFVAPAWSMSSAVLPVLKSRGYAFAEDHMWAYRPASDGRTFAPVLNYASRSPLRIATTVAYARAARPLGRIFPMRIAIHPGDMGKLLLAQELKALLAWAAPHVVRRGTDLLQG